MTVMEHPVDFKRMVLGLPHNRNDYDAVAFAAGLANVLDLELIGIFAPDENLVHLASLPCSREFRLSTGWQRIDPRQLEQGSIQAAVDARRLFGEAAKALRPGARFDLADEPIGEIISAQLSANDIIAVIEPRNPAERVTHQFTQLLGNALAAPSATLLVPSRISRRSGPVVAFATSDNDPSIIAALRLAQSTNEKLLLFTPPDAREQSRPRSFDPSKVAVVRHALRGEGIGASELNILLAHTGERIVVLSRGANIDTLVQLAFERGIPILVTEPG